VVWLETIRILRFHANRPRRRPQNRTFGRGAGQAMATSPRPADRTSASRRICDSRRLDGAWIGGLRTAVGGTLRGGERVSRTFPTASVDAWRLLRTSNPPPTFRRQGDP